MGRLKSLPDFTKYPVRRRRHGSRLYCELCKQDIVSGEDFHSTGYFSAHESCVTAARATSKPAGEPPSE